MVIRSGSNNTYKYIYSLKSKKGRENAGTFVVEGIKMTGEALAYNGTMIIAASEEYAKEDGRYLDTEIKTAVFTDSLFKKLSETENTQGILSVCLKHTCAPNSIINSSSNGLFILLDDINDPGNLGTIIRTADAAGADGVFLSANCAELHNPKTLRATAGSIFNIPIAEGMDLTRTIGVLQQKGANVYAAHLMGDISPYALNLRRGCAFIIGNEARGISDDLAAISDGCIKLPMIGKAESLNAASAAAILLYEAVRQRITGVDNNF